jgi:hypothetical protein
MKNTASILLLISTIFCLVSCAGQSEMTTPTVKITEPAKTEQTKPLPKPDYEAKPIPVLKPEPVQKPAPAPKPVLTTKIKSGGEKLTIFGEAEYITIKPDNIRLKARIDTGATTSSIHATQVKRYERDGKKWVKFNLVRNNGQKIAMNKRVIRTIEVKRHGADQQSRPVVNLDIAMGKIKKTTQFSLTDRSQFKFPVLIGRSLLKGTAIVDVNRSYVLSPLSKGDDNAK